ncbi:MAG: indole-3-glycerol phosphate synthase TrpC [Bacillota bacterium]|nr:indole-3-glycerol phosphate synthase TrpC [Bacillota bacterium]
MLAEILAHKRLEVAEREISHPLENLLQQKRPRPPRPFAAALRQRPAPALIAEIKWASPSAGSIRPVGDPAAVARIYEENGAAAVSVLTDTPFFRGHPSHLPAVSEAAGLPVLRKDFIISPYQVYESRVLGADAVLLIVAALDAGGLRELLEVARSLEIEALVEVHDERELSQALDVGATLLAVNNRNLKTMRCDPGTFPRLAPLVPRDITLVAASGIATREQALAAARAGADAVLVGQALMASPDIAAAVRKLSGMEA